MAVMSTSAVADLAIAWQQPPPEGCDYGLRGQAYLEALRSLVPTENLIALPGDPQQYSVAYTRIGRDIHRLNQALNRRLEQCQSCLHPSVCPAVVVLAAPLSAIAGITGFCQLALTPHVLLVDIGQAYPQDWLAIVAHEYAHGIAGSQGHGPAFQAAIAHLCLGLGLVSPPLQITDPGLWQIWPPRRAALPNSNNWPGTFSPGVLP